MEHLVCCNPSLGFATKVRACKGVGQAGSPGITFHAHGNIRKCEGMNLELPSKFPLWELESQWSPKSLKSDCKGSKPIGLTSSLYNWKALGM